MTTWNPADKSAGTTLSGGDLVATMAANTDGARSTTSKNSGKVAFSVIGDFAAGSLGVGISKSGASYAGFDANSFVVAYNAGFGGWLVASNMSIVAGPSASFPPTSSSGVLVLLDSSGKLYFQCDGNNLFGADPVAGTGGVTVAADTWFADICSISIATAGTADFTPGSLPSGFSDWDGSTPTVTAAAKGSTMPMMGV